ncbi:MAG TPA: glycosyltransferase family 9 protein, partial [Candidatus Binatia bacterium]|nr:glycosyltransferase family 9 protein [Candidatus Binatia bacterium]
GSPVSQSLFQGQRLNDHYITPRRFPHVLWQYPRLIRRLRGNRYDLAVDVSCSQSGAGAFIVGVSGSRIRAGMAGKWDRLFNLKVAKLRERNKYAKLAALLAALDLEEIDRVGALEFSATERIQALTRLNDITGKSLAKTVGICVGGRKLRGKRWPLENFAEVISRLQERGVGVVTFLGPEEKDLVETLPKSLPSVPVVLEPSLRKFAAIVAHLDLLICADSGPMHLACAVDVPVLAVFQPRNLKRWAPPAHAARSLSHPDGVSADMVVAAALEMLSVERSPDDSPAPRVSSARPGI